MLGFYVLLQDPDVNVIIAPANIIIALHCCSAAGWWFLHAHDLGYIADQPRPLATGEDAAANRHCWSSFN